MKVKSKKTKKPKEKKLTQTPMRIVCKAEESESFILHILLLAQPQPASKTLSKKET